MLERAFELPVRARSRRAAGNRDRFRVAAGVATPSRARRRPHGPDHFARLRTGAAGPAMVVFPQSGEYPALSDALDRLRTTLIDRSVAGIGVARKAMTRIDMFDLITGTGERPLRERSVTSKVVAVATHVVVIVVVIAIPLLRVTNQLPELPTMRAFVVAPSAPPPPPPPPPPPAPPSSPRAAVKPVAATTGQFAAPVDAPHAIEPERLIARDESIAGALGGVEGGVPGGVTGGVVGGILSSVAPPPPPPPPPPPAPVDARPGADWRADHGPGAAEPRRADLSRRRSGGPIERHRDSRGGGRHGWLRRVGPDPALSPSAAGQGVRGGPPAVALFAAGAERHPDPVRADGHLQLQRPNQRRQHCALDAGVALFQPRRRMQLWRTTASPGRSASSLRAR